MVWGMFKSMLRQGSCNIDVFDKVREFSDLTMTKIFSVADNKNELNGAHRFQYIHRLFGFRTGARTMDTAKVKKKYSPPSLKDA